MMSVLPLLLCFFLSFAQDRYSFGGPRLLYGRISNPNIGNFNVNIVLNADGVGTSAQYEDSINGHPSCSTCVGIGNVLTTQVTDLHGPGQMSYHSFSMTSRSVSYGCVRTGTFTLKQKTPTTVLYLEYDRNGRVIFNSTLVDQLACIQ